MLIVLDPGHGGSDPGAVGPTGLREASVNLALALLVGRQLVEAGHTVQLTRTGDTAMALDARASFANRIRAGRFVSIHCNSAENPGAHGAETFAFSPMSGGAPLAQRIQTEMIRSTGLRDRGVKFQNFAVLRRTQMAAALVKVAFINNREEERLLRDPAFQQKAAHGITVGICVSAAAA